MRLQTSTEYMVLNMSHITKIHDYSDVHCNKRIVTATSLCPQSCPTVIWEKLYILISQFNAY